MPDRKHGSVSVTTQPDSPDGRGGYPEKCRSDQKCRAGIVFGKLREQPREDRPQRSGGQHNPPHRAGHPAEECTRDYLLSQCPDHNAGQYIGPDQHEIARRKPPDSGRQAHRRQRDTGNQGGRDAQRNRMEPSDECGSRRRAEHATESAARHNQADQPRRGAQIVASEEHHERRGTETQICDDGQDRKRHQDRGGREIAQTITEFGPELTPRRPAVGSDIRVARREAPTASQVTPRTCPRSPVAQRPIRH